MDNYNASFETLAKVVEKKLTDEPVDKEIFAKLHEKYNKSQEIKKELEDNRKIMYNTDSIQIMYNVT